MGTSDSTLSFRQISNSTSYLRLEKVTTTVRGLASAGRMAITSRRARSAGRRAGLIADLGVHSFIYCYRRMCTMSRLTLEARELGVSYGEEVVFSNESFRLEGPGLVVVMGPNGAGKTTLFRALLGLIPVRGRVLVNGEDVTGRPERAGRLIGYVPQWRGEDYHFPVSVREVVESLVNPVYVAGGFSSVEEIRFAKRCGAAGVVVGSALYTGRLKFEDALRVAHEEEEED